jgi:hypothetical protein
MNSNFLPAYRRQRWRKIRWFAAVIRSPAEVRHAFDDHLLIAWWWAIVMRLHGSAVPKRLLGDRVQCVADGFWFYGLLYRILAAVFGISGILCWFQAAVDMFWIVTLLGCSACLWVIAELAFSGAREFLNSSGRRIWHLVVFLFFVSWLLASICTAVSLEVRHLGGLPDSVNLSLTIGIIVFGVGSYLVELAALVAVRCGEMNR